MTPSGTDGPETPRDPEIFQDYETPQGPEALVARATSAADRAEVAEQAAEKAEVGAEDALAGAREAEQGAEQARDDAATVAAAAVAYAEEVPNDDPLLETAVRRLEAQVSEDAPYGVPGPPVSTRSPFRIGFTAALGVALAYGLVHALITIRSVLVLLLIAAFLAVGLNPAVEFFQRRGLRRGRAVAVVLVLVLLVFAGVLYAIVPPIVEQSQQFATQAPQYLKDLERNRTVASLDRRFHFLKQLTATVQSPATVNQAFGGVLGVGKVVFSAVFSTLTVLTLMLYFMSSLPTMKHSALRALPRSRRARVGLLLDDILERIGSYVAGCLTIAACAGALTFVVLEVTGVPYPLALTLVVVVTDLVPVIGATIGAVAVTLAAFTVSVPVGVGVGLYYLAYQQVENFLIYPRIMQRSVDVSPAATIVAVLVGGSLLGVLGALLAIPIAAAVQLVMLEVIIPRQDAA